MSVPVITKEVAEKRKKKANGEQFASKEEGGHYCLICS
jgi:hypothetical protein